MLCLARKPSLKIEICEALLRRAVLQASERVLIEDLLCRARRGQEGEQRADQFWLDLQLKQPHILLHNYETMNAGGFTHQMDTLFLCEHFALVVELKHVAGELSYDKEHHQLLRVLNGEMQSFSDPFSQVMRHEEWLRRCLQDMGLALPVLSAVIVTTSSSILKEMPKYPPVFKLAGLRLKLRDWLAAYPACIDQNMLQLVREELLLRYQPRKWQHPLGQLTIRTGALCPCGRRMTYRYGKFICSCGHSSRDALPRGLYDYRLLVSEWITNRELRAFFSIESADAANKLLKRSGFVSEGMNKGKRYFIPEDVWRINT